jgi:phage FluMu gp28-like protein
LPLWLQPGIVDGGWNKQSITLGNGSRIIATSTASSAIRGYTINSLFLDEFAFVPPQIAEEFMNSVYPTVSSGKTSKIIIVSTPNGMNHFYNIWIDAIRGKNSYFPVKINWWEVPGRDDNFKKEIIRNQGITSWNQEYNCSSFQSIINIRNKENGLIKSVSGNELWEFGNKIFDK